MVKFDDNALPIFKYRSLGDKWGRGAAIDIILHNRMWWQSPRDFNDPFDCVPVFKLSGGLKERRASVRKTVKKFMGSEPRWRRRQEVREAPLRPRHEVVQSMVEETNRWMLNSAISCFSEIPDNHLMWSHYADAHRGVCFCFRQVPVGPPLYFYRVQYATERPVIEMNNEMGITEYMRLVLVKAADWSYEREMRMIDYRNPPGFRQFPPAMLTGVILGCRTSGDDEEFIRDLLGKRNPEIGVYRARLAEGKYGLDIIEAT